MTSIVAHDVSKQYLPIKVLQRIPNNEPLKLFLVSPYSSDNFPIALLPHANMTTEDVATSCMDALQQNNNPRRNACLEVCFDFSSDRCHAALGGILDDFILFATNPTFRSMINVNEYVVLNVGPLIAGTRTRGAMQMVLIKVTPTNGDDRMFLWYVSYNIGAWSKATSSSGRNVITTYLIPHSKYFSDVAPIRTMQQECRPPRQGLWLIHECIFVDNAFALTF